MSNGSLTCRDRLPRGGGSRAARDLPRGPVRERRERIAGHERPSRHRLGRRAPLAPGSKTSPRTSRSTPRPVIPSSCCRFVSASAASSRLEEWLVVELIVSHAPHQLRRSNPDFDELRAALEEARSEGAACSSPRPTTTRSSTSACSTSPRRPWSSPRRAAVCHPAASAAALRARQLASLLSGQLPAALHPVSLSGQRLLGPGARDVPSDDRRRRPAREDLDLRNAAPSLRASQPQNKPNCVVEWGWHVAPTLQVATASGVADLGHRSLALRRAGAAGDWAASRATRPLARAVERSDLPALAGRRLDRNRSHLRKTKRRSGDVPQRAHAALGRARRSAAVLRVHDAGRGVQWFGSIGPNATRRWFTFGWGAAWHVIWTVMPLTPCPGGPQLTW